MASITKRGGKWRAMLWLGDNRPSKTFSTKAEARQWAAEQEAKFHQAAVTGIVPDKTLGDAFERYEEQVSANKPGKKWEGNRLRFFTRYEIDNKALGTLPLSQVTPEILGKYRDKRMGPQPDGTKPVAGSTINRELKLYSHVFSVARDEWQWLTKSPTKGVQRPKESEHRDRLMTQDEIDRICMALGFSATRKPVTTKSAVVAVATLFAIETAMRAGEICALVHEWIDGNVVHLPARVCKSRTKRDVPLSKRALDLLTYLPGGSATVFDVTSATLDTIFRRARDRCGILDCRFHDARHTAITRLAKKLAILDLATMTGHRDVNELLVYYNESAADIAAKLD